MDKTWSCEELKVYIGAMTLDLRSDWSDNYSDRIAYVINAYGYLIEKDPSVLYKEDYLVAQEEYQDPEDGRIFRDSCCLYAYYTEEGFTKRVFQELKQDVNDIYSIGQ